MDPRSRDPIAACIRIIDDTVEDLIFGVAMNNLSQLMLSLFDNAIYGLPRI